MAETTKNRITRMLLSKNRNAQYAKLFIVMAACVVVAVAVALHQTGVAMTHKEQVLTCPVEGVVAHTHDESCYDKDGNLVCTLPERELHVHTDDCYTETRELTCGQEESKEHKHTDECYTVTRELTCGQEEVTEEHVHGPGCFTTIEVQNDDSDEGSVEESVQEDELLLIDEDGDLTQDALVIEGNEDVFMPAQQFEDEILDDEGNLWVHVSVNAPKGAFPEGTTMHIAPLDEESVRTKVEDALKKDDEKVAGVKQMKAVDISFTDADGNEIEPAVEVEVKLTSDTVRELANPTLVHVDKNKKKDAEVLKKVDVVNQDEADKTKGTEDTLKFESDTFSPYVIVEPSIITADVITASGKTYRITVSYGEDAGIAQGAELKVKEITEDTEEYWDYYKKAAEAMGEEGGPSHARFFDIEIQVDGKKVEPAAPVETTISYVEGIELDPNDVVTAVHFPNKSAVELMDVDANMEGTEFTFEQESFSVTGIAKSTVGTGDYIIYRASTNNYALKWDLEKQGVTVSNGYVESDNDNIVWHFATSGSGYKISYTNGSTTKYLRVDGDILNADANESNASVWSYSNNALTTSVTTKKPKGPSTTTIYYLRYSSYKFEVSTSSGEIYLAKVQQTPQSGSGITIHYVDEQGNEIEGVPAEELAKGTNANDGINEPKDIVKTIEGYTYHNTFIGNGTNRIQIVPELKVESANSGKWQYQAYGQQTFTTISAATDIYVVYGDSYLKQAAGSSSGSSQFDPASIVPQAGKVLTPNDDGTYTLSLNVTAKGDTGSESNGANVILILDTSSSMNGTVTGGTRFSKAVEAAQDVSSELLGLNTTDEPNLVEMCLVEFNWDISTSGWYTDAGQKQSNGKYPEGSFNRKIADAARAQGTNWEGALQAAINAANAHDDGDQTYIVFLTDGNPSAYTGTNNGKGRYGSGDEGESNTSASDGKYYRKSPNYMHATDEARAIVQNGWYFYSVGMYGNVDVLEHLTKFAYTGRSGNDTDTTNNPDPHYYKAADTDKLVAALGSIAEAIKNTIGLAGVVLHDGIATDVTHTALSTQVGSGNTIGCVTYEKTGGDSPKYTVNVDASGASTFTVGSTTKAGTTTSVTYKKISGSGSSISTSNATATVYSAKIGDTTYQMPMATLDDDGNLQWDLSPLGMLEPGATYKISFVVWPDQDAYDFVADLNNGKANWDTSSQKPVKNSKGEVLYYKNGVSEYPNIVKYANGKFAALTNTNQSLDYYVVDEVTTGGHTNTTYYSADPLTLDFPSPMGLTSSSSKLQKAWNAELQKTQIISFLYDTNTGKPKTNMHGIDFSVKKDNKAYKNITLGWDDDSEEFKWAGDTEEVTYKDKSYTIGSLWEEELAIANGLMVSADRAAELKLNTAKYASGTYKGKIYYILEEGHDYKVVEPTLDGGYAFDFESKVYHPMLVDGELKNVTFTKSGSTATFTDIENMTDGIRVENVLRGGINLSKVVSNDQNSTQKFSFEVTLTNQSAVFKEQDIPWFSVNDCYYHDENGYKSSGDEDEANILEASSDGKTATTRITIKPSDRVRIANVPNGTTYTIVEQNKNGYELEDIDLTIAIGGNSESVDEGINISERKVTSTIVQNRENNVVFTNKRVNQVIRFRKVAQDMNHGLAGAEFTLKIGEETHTLTSDKNGNLYEVVDGDKKQYEFELPMTTANAPYQMTETVAPSGYLKIDGSIQIYVNDSGVTAEKSGTQYTVEEPADDDATGVGTILIPNSAGEELPATGGAGTTAIYAMGITLVGIAAFGLVSKKMRNNL